MARPVSPSCALDRAKRVLQNPSSLWGFRFCFQSSNIFFKEEFITDSVTDLRDEAGEETEPPSNTAESSTAI